MGKKIRNIVIAAVVILCLLGILVLLIPLEKRVRELEEYGDLAVAAESDERARYIIDNIDIYTKEFALKYNTADDDKKENTLNFIYNYAFHKDDYASMQFTAEELDAKEVPALYMSDFRWGYETIGGAFIKEQGCAAVSLTMANLYLNHNDNITPVIAARKAEECGGINILGGMNSLHIKQVAEGLGMNCVEYNYDSDLGGSGSADIETIQSVLDSGHVLMAGMAGKTFGGHAIIIRECSDDGIIYINDPADAKKTEKAWNFEDIQQEIYYLWDLS